MINEWLQRRNEIQLFLYRRRKFENFKALEIRVGKKNLPHEISRFIEISTFANTHFLWCSSEMFEDFLQSFSRIEHSLLLCTNVLFQGDFVDPLKVSSFLQVFIFKDSLSWTLSSLFLFDFKVMFLIKKQFLAGCYSCLFR